MTVGKHLIAGEWIDTPETFWSSPVRGPRRPFPIGTAEDVETACSAAEDAFWEFGYSTRAERAVLLRRIAEEIDARGDELTAIGAEETGLPEARLIGERGRTTGQLQLFADHIEKSDYLDIRHDEALPDRLPLPRPDLRMIQQPIGPVAVFGASNFPLAFSTAGGDTAAALAAGCPVVVKGHPAHPGTGEIVAQAIHAAITATDAHPGVFSMIHGQDRVVGEALVQHPLIRAVGFTGSLAGGRALFDLCADRPEPIPFFGELGSINPVFVLPAALTARAEEIGAAWAGSLTMGVGQFCTNPGLVVLPNDPNADAFISAALKTLSSVEPQPMLTDGIADAFRDGCNRVAGLPGVNERLAGASEGRMASPSLQETSAKTWFERDGLAHEVFGPFGLVVRAEGVDEMVELARGLQGQLTCTLQMDPDDHAAVSRLLTVLERKAGRILANGFPTGVEVSDAMVHGGPYPASTNFGATSVGTLSIRRFLRPVCYQNVPEVLLPGDLRS